MTHSTEYKSDQRRINNRLSAQKSRMKIKETIQDLKNKIKILKNENRVLKDENITMWNIVFPGTIFCNEILDESFFSQLQ
tara:strand:+ start:294 stop:533 length:240 start_codon:yes stop_codon:yes gene_type:complete